MKLPVFNFRSALSALLCCVALAATASAQEAAPSRVRVAPPNEAFTVMMPRMPFPVAERVKSGALEVAGQRYSLLQDDAVYTVWSFKAAKIPAALDADREAYLDQCAEIAWELLIEPYWKKLRRESPEQLGLYNLHHEGTLPASGHPGRSYQLNLGEQRGMTHIYAVGPQIYIVAAAGTPRQTADIAEFIKSFALSLPVPDAPAPVATGTGGGPGRGGSAGESNSGGGGVSSGGEAGEIDYTRTFSSREVTRKAQLKTKPEPSYTESARKFGVTGVVRVRLVLAASGEVSTVTVIKTLPHGLVQEAVKAARKVRFEPAIKDGRPVSQYVLVEYNFNIY